MTQQRGILRKIRKEFDYRSYLETHFSVKYVPNGEIRVCCPNCDDHKHKLYVNDDKKLFQCFKCGFSNREHDVFDLVARTEQIPRGKAILILMREYAEVAPDWSTLIKQAQDHYLNVDENEPNESLPIKTLSCMPDCSAPLTSPSEAMERPFWNYLLGRGITESEVLAMKIHYVPKQRAPIYGDDKKFRGNLGRRFLIPVYGGDHKLVSWVARTIEDADPKYLNSPESDISRTFWPFVPPRGHRAVIVEGNFDALAVRRAGLDAYASFGKSLSLDQIEQLKAWDVTEVTLFWDKRDAVREMKKTISTLKMHFEKITVPSFKGWPLKKDAGDTLHDPELACIMQEMLTSEKIEVDTWEYIQWLTW